MRARIKFAAGLLLLGMLAALIGAVIPGAIVQAQTYAREPLQWAQARKLTVFNTSDFQNLITIDSTGMFWTPTDTAATSTIGMMYFDLSEKAPKFYNGTSWIALPGTSATGTLDNAYDSGGAGNGRTVTAHDGAVVLSSTDVDGNDILQINKSPGTSQAGEGAQITMGSNATGSGLLFVNGGSGDDVQGTSDTWSVTKAGVGTLVSLTSGAITSAVTTDLGNKISRNQATTTADLLEIEVTNTSDDETALLIDHKATGSVDAVEIVSATASAGLHITTSAAAGTSIDVDAANSMTGRMIYGDLGTWLGTADEGVIEIVTDSASQIPAGQIINIDQQGTGQHATAINGTIIDMEDNAAAPAAGTSYMMYLDGNAIEAMYIDTGDVKIDDALSAGTVQVTTLLNVDEDVDIDLDANDEEISVVSTAADYAAGAGILTIYDDSTGQTNTSHLLRLVREANADANDSFILCEDSSTGAAASGDTMFEVGASGNVTIAGTTAATGTLTGTGTITAATIQATVLLDVNEDVDIDFDAKEEEFILTTSATDYVADSAVVTFTSSGAGATNNTYLLRLRNATDGDAQDHFLVAEDTNGTADLFALKSGGDTDWVLDAGAAIGIDADTTASTVATGVLALTWQTATTASEAITLVSQLEDGATATIGLSIDVNDDTTGAEAHSGITVANSAGTNATVTGITLANTLDDGILATIGAAGQALVIDSGTTANTGTDGVIDVLHDTATDGNEFMNIDSSIGDLADAETATVILIDMDDDDTDTGGSTSIYNGVSVNASDLTGNAVVTAFYVTAADVALQADKGYVRIGTGATPDVTPSDDDLFVEGTVEIDGAIRADGGIVGAGDAVISGMLKTVTADADGKTVSVTESGTIQTNTGAVGGGVWNLPEASTAIGMEITFVVTVAQNLDINPGDADIILEATNAAGDALRSATIGDTITLLCIDATNWVVQSAYPVNTDWADNG